MVFPCAWRRANATTTNRMGVSAVARTVSYLTEKLVDMRLRLYRHQYVLMCINVCSFDCSIDWML
jgi:hypothetical protein